MSVLHAHLVFVTKYPRPVVTDAMLTYCEHTTHAVHAELDVELVGQTDHVHPHVADHHPRRSRCWRSGSKDAPPTPCVGNTRFWLLTFTFVAVAISFAQAWPWLKTDSVWPPIFLHASHNLWMQSIFTPLTTDREHTKWVADDLGIGLVIVATVVAVVFWLKRGELPSRACG
ncbi:MAG: protease family protein [Mycobacterium sp.]|nr:protease family protein [Mycobacterium sp.]